MNASGLLLAVTVLASVAARGQGQFVFNNRLIPAGIDARFVLPSDPPGVSSVGTDFQGQLLGGPAGTPVEKLVLLDNAVDNGLQPAIIRFRGPAGWPAAGYVVPMTPVVPGVSAAGGDATVLIRIFDGPSWETATYRFERIWNFRLVDLPNMPLGMEPLVLHAVPEPRILTLALLGLSALACRFRRKISATLTLGLLAASLEVHGQGEFYFNNRVGSEVDARFVLSIDPPGSDFGASQT